MFVTVVVDADVVKRLTPVMQEAKQALREDLSYFLPVLEDGKNFKSKKEARLMKRNASKSER